MEKGKTSSTTRKTLGVLKPEKTIDLRRGEKDKDEEEKG
jgi:hypothetical protein